ncbi:MAG: SDR family oxidoreductase [Nitrospirota bacterium]|nr:SDR family oxidoreductase [Nitrospirota bacterium]
MSDHAMTALITGAAGGIGRVLCAEFRRAGYRVIGTDMAGAPGIACDHFVEADLKAVSRDEACLKRFVQQLNIPASGLTALVNNAAVQILNRTDTVSVQDWRDTLDVNVLAPFLLTQALLPYLEKAGGSVVNMGSVHAIATKPGFVCYATSKAALVGLTRALAVDLGGRIRVNAINPAAVATPMLLQGFKGKDAQFSALGGMHPLGRIAEPAEIAQVVLFLVSRNAAFITGAAFDVDGGILSRLHDPD